MPDDTESETATHHFQVNPEDLTAADTGLPACPECDAADVLGLASGEFVCQDCHHVFAADDT